MTPRKGTMLLEVVLALAITALVLTGGGLALRTISQFAGALQRAASAEQQSRSSEMLLRSLGRLALRTDTTQFIIGTSEAFTFPSSCTAAAGWAEPCVVSIQGNHDERNRGQKAFRVILSAADSFYFARGTGSIRFLSDARNGGVWQTDWQDSVRFPLAIELVAARESLFIRLGTGLP